MRCVCLLVVVAGCGKTDQPPAPPPHAPEPPPKPIHLSPAADRGHCTLDATGAFTAEEISDGGTSAVSSKYWLSDVERAGAPQAALVVTCAGKDLRLSIATKPDASAPFGPKTYQVAGKTGDLVILGRAGKPLEKFAGTVDVTAFDGKHVAGTIALTAKQTGGKAVRLDGHFDFACPGYGGCAH